MSPQPPHSDAFPRLAIDTWTSAPWACFADEVAIDFPSVEPLIARERDAFLGEDDPAVLTAEVSLSLRDAWMGAVVALDLPVRRACANCGGRGESWAEPCDPCHGTGDAFVPRPVTVPVPPGVTDGTRLRFRLRAASAPHVRVEVRVAVRPPVV